MKLSQKPQGRTGNSCQPLSAFQLPTSRMKPFYKRNWGPLRAEQGLVPEVRETESEDLVGAKGVEGPGMNSCQLCKSAEKWQCV